MFRLSRPFMLKQTACLATLLVVFAASAADDAKKTITSEDVKTWESLGGYTISKDGHWVAFGVSTQSGESNLTVRNTDGPQTWTTPNGGQAIFSDDSKWVGNLISPPKAVADKLREEKKPVESKFCLRDLASGTERIMDGVQRFVFLKGSKTLLVLKSAPAGKADGGTDLLVINLADGMTTPITNVVSFDSNYAGDLVSVLIKSDSGDKGVQVFDPSALTMKTLAWGKDDVSGLQFAERGDTLGFMAGKTDDKKVGAFNRIILVNNVRQKQSYTVFDPGTLQDFPKGKRITETGFSLSREGDAVAFGVKEWADKKAPGKPSEVSQPEVWNTKDIRTIPEQRVSAGADRARGDLYVWQPKGNTYKFISDAKQASISLLEGYKRALINDRQPYADPKSNGWTLLDVVVADTATGVKTKVLEKSHWGGYPSRMGRYFTYYMGRRWFVYDIEQGKTLDPFKNLKTTFENTEDDHTTPEKPPADFPMWLADDAGFVVGDDYDEFLVRMPSGTVTKLTDGRKDRQTYRFAPMDRPMEDGPRIDRPFAFSVFDEDLMATGFYICDANGKGKIVALDKFAVSGLARAGDTDRVIFRMENNDKSPNVFVTNLEFSAMKPVSKTNPQQSKFFWPKSELVEYKSRWGQKLHGILMYPADYQPKRKYPMVTYIYERLSSRMYNYSGPSDRNAYNSQWFCQNGYFVFMPDIAYKGRTPGKNAVDCLEPAVEAVLKMNVGVDSDKIGLMGHSWGAYQTAYVTTVSKMFKVGVAGAPLTELVSMANTHYWNSGTPNSVILETSQGRLEVPFWADPKNYIDQSPVWLSEKRTAPILVTVGDQDGAVDYHQGVALYNTLRRMGKEAVLLLYYGENHNFTREPDQRDYAKRVRHYFDVYLKGAKPEPWIKDGVPFIDRD